MNNFAFSARNWESKGLAAKFFSQTIVEMQLCIVAHDAHFNQPANSQRVPFKNKSHDKTSAMRNVHVLCSNYPPPATTQAQSLFHHSPMTLSMMRWSSLSYSSTMRFCSLWTSLILVL